MCSCKMLCVIGWEGSKEERSLADGRSRGRSGKCVHAESGKKLDVLKAKTRPEVSATWGDRDLQEETCAGLRGQTGPLKEGGAGNSMSSFPAGVFRTGTWTTVA